MKSKEYHGILRCITPQYDELTLFAMSFTCGLLLLVGALSSKWEIQMVPFSEGDFGISIIILFFLAGLILSLYHVFTDQLKTSLEKYLMLFFAVILNAFTGIWAGTYFLDGVTGWLAIFPIVNIISGGFLLVMFRSGALDEHNVSDQNVSRGQVALAAIAVVALVRRLSLHV